MGQCACDISQNMFGFKIFVTVSCFRCLVTRSFIFLVAVTVGEI